MIESIKEFWYLWLVIAVLVIVIIPLIIKVSKSVAKRNDANEKMRKEFERIKMLNEKYSSVDRETVVSADAKELAEGVTAVIQYKLEKSQTPDADFENEPEWKREVYALFYFNEDVTESCLSDFFRFNGGALPKEAVNGIESIGYSKIQSVVGQVYAMCDDRNENVSFDKAKISELDEKFAKIYNIDEFFALVKSYIESNIQN